MSLAILKNGDLTVKIDTLGAQLVSVTDREGVERIWQADPAVWGRHAPLLFPVIGRLQDGKYTLDGKPYAISQHGFARDSEFTLEHLTQQEAVFGLRDSEQTRAVYPFSFQLAVRYELSGPSIVKQHRISNTSSVPMYCELGGHDGFATALLPGEGVEDYCLEFPGMSALRPYGMDGACMVTPKGAEYPLEEGGRLPLPPRVLGLDTVILDDVPGRRVSLVGKKNTRRVTLEFEDFPYLGIWTKSDSAPYICIEPWSTLPDAVFAGRGLEDKPGVLRLAPGESRILRYTTTFGL